MGVPIVAQGKPIWLGTMKLRVRFLASLSGLQIWCCCGCGVSLSYKSDSAPSLGTSLCHRYSPEKKKRTERKEKRKITRYVYKLPITLLKYIFVTFLFAYPLSLHIMKYYKNTFYRKTEKIIQSFLHYDWSKCVLEAGGVFWLCPGHVEVPGPGIKPQPQQRQCWILNC